VLTLRQFSNLVVEIVPDSEAEIIDPPKKMGRPPGALNSVNRIIKDVMQSCLEAGFTPGEALVKIAMDPSHPIPVTLKALDTILKYTEPQFRAIEYLGHDPSGLNIVVSMDAFVKERLPAPKTNGANGSKP